MIKNGFDSKNSCQDTAKVMNPEQFDCIVKAIVEGRYSWACVLILRFAGYNPAHYIPYRTYKRLIKENRQRQIAEQPLPEPIPNADCSTLPTEYSFSQTMRHSTVNR